MDREKATARLIGGSSAPKPDSDRSRLARPFQQPTILATSSRPSSLFSSASCAWKVRATAFSSTARTSTL